MNSFDLTKEEAEEIFREIIIPQITGNIHPEQTKQAYVLGGQPGSGKSAFARELIKINKNIVFINGDDLRSYHPKYFLYLKENDIEAADLTQAVCNFWIESLIEECIKVNLNFIVEGTMRRKEVPLQTAKKLHDSGYDVNLAVVSTPYELSLLSLDYRYKELKRLGQPARFTKKESHDEAYGNLESNVTELVASGLFNKIYIYKRNPDGFEENVFNSEQREFILKSFTEGRHRSLEDKEKKGTFFDESTFGIFGK